jgi:DNA-binding XRE family transcriptional regulator
VKNTFINEFGFDDEEGTPPSAEQVEAAEHYLKGFAPFGLKKKSSYTLKHDAEKAAGQYITNGAMIKALINRGFEVKREAGSKNGMVFISPINSTDDDNIVKRVCKELGITQKELAERLGASEGTVRNWSASNEPPEWANKFMALMLENEKNKKVGDKLRELLSLVNSETP